MAVLVQPGPGVEPDGRNDKRVALEAPDGEPVPGGPCVLQCGQLAAVHPDLPPVVTVLEKLDDAIVRLDDLEGVVRLDDLGRQVPGNAGGLAPPDRIVSLELPAVGAVAGPVVQVLPAPFLREWRLRGRTLVGHLPVDRVAERSRYVAVGDDGGLPVPVSREIARVEGLIVLLGGQRGKAREHGACHESSGLPADPAAVIYSYHRCSCQSCLQEICAVRDLNARFLHVLRSIKEIPASLCRYLPRKYSSFS